MPGFSGEQIHDVRQYRTDNRKALTDSFWGTGKIDDQTSASSAANTTRNHTHSCVLERFSSHRFRQPGCFTFNDSSSSFWGVITRAKAGTTGCLLYTSPSPRDS